jgi:hypothetical protein
MADKALIQVKDDELFKIVNDESNSIAVLMKHLSGNMIHRWTYLYKLDDEKPKRNRDREFLIESDDTTERIYYFWEMGWQQLFNLIDGLSINDLSRIIQIRWKKYSVIEALNRQLTHYSLHVGQIIFLSKYFRGKTWETLSIPKGASEPYNERLRKERLES